MTNSSLGLGRKVVTQMLQVVDKGCHGVYYDNFFTSFDLLCHPSNEVRISCMQNDAKKTEQKAAVFDQKRPLKVKKEDGMKKKLKLMKEFQ